MHYLFFIQIQVDWATFGISFLGFIVASSSFVFAVNKTRKKDLESIMNKKMDSDIANERFNLKDVEIESIHKDIAFLEKTKASKPEVESLKSIMIAWQEVNNNQFAEIKDQNKEMQKDIKKLIAKI